MLRIDELVFSFAPRLDARNTRENIQTHDSVGGKYLWFSRWCENKQQRLHKGSQNIYLSFSLWLERKTAADDGVAARLSSAKGESLSKQEILSRTALHGGEGEDWTGLDYTTPGDGVKFMLLSQAMSGSSKRVSTDNHSSFTSRSFSVPCSKM